MPGTGDRPLYIPNDYVNLRSYQKQEKHNTGRLLFEQFTCVVQLTQQWRCKDPKWQNLLDAVRHKVKWTEKHTNYLQSLVLPVTERTRISSKHDSSFWSKAKLCTPRRLIRDTWNTKAVEVHAKGLGQQIYKVRSLDRTRDGKALSRLQTAHVAALKSDRRPVSIAIIM